MRKPLAWIGVDLSAHDSDRVFVGPENVHLTGPQPGWDPGLAGCGVLLEDNRRICLLPAGHDGWHRMETWEDIDGREESPR